jgi:hypothetical protein
MNYYKNVYLGTAYRNCIRSGRKAAIGLTDRSALAGSAAARGCFNSLAEIFSFFCFLAIFCTAYLNKRVKPNP